MHKIDHIDYLCQPNTPVLNSKVQKDVQKFFATDNKDAICFVVNLSCVIFCTIREENDNSFYRKSNFRSFSVVLCRSFYAIYNNLR